MQPKYKRGKQSKRARAPKSKRKVKTPRRRANPIAPYVNMLINPCKSTLIPGLYGSSEGMLARLKSSSVTYPIFGGAPDVSTCGYVLWCPDYANNNAFPVVTGNCFQWQNVNSATRPLNSSVTPYGLEAPGTATALQTTTATLKDPAYDLLQSDIVADARVLSACLSMTYFGRMDESAGEYAVIGNLPAAELLTGGAAGTVMNVDELMLYANSKKRFGIDTHEAVYQPSQTTSSVFRPASEALFNIFSGAGGSFMEPNAQVLGPRVFGFVWRRTTPGSGLSFEMTKSIEWRPEASSGLTQVPRHTFSNSKLNVALATIDRMNASVAHTGLNFWERTATELSSASTDISKAAFTGVSSGLRKGAGNVFNAGVSAVQGRVAQIAASSLETMLLGLAV